MMAEKKIGRLFWPSTDTVEAAAKLKRYGVGAAIFIAIINALGEESKQVEQESDHRAGIVSGSGPTDQPLARRHGFGEGQQVRSNTPTRCDPISPYSLWIGCYGKQNIRLIVRIIRGYSKHRVNDAIETLHGLIITQE